MGVPPAAHRVAADLAQRIVDSGWRVGTRLGTESGLMDELGVGRATFREAVRILERQGVVRAEAGARGGLIVEAPAAKAFSNVIRNYIELSDVSFGELDLAHRILTHLAADLALKRVTPARLNDLRTALKLPTGGRLSRDQQGMALTVFEKEMLRLADNPALGHFTSTLSRLMADFSHLEKGPREFWRKTVQDLQALNEAIFLRLAERDSDVHKAIEERSDYAAAMVARLEQTNRKIWSTASFLSGAYTSALIGRTREQKAGLKLSYELAAFIRRSDLAPGARLGTEQEIATSYNVSRTMAVEGLRMLEFLGIIRICRGRTAGVEVIKPDPRLVVEAAALYLEYIDPLATDLQCIRRSLERGAITSISDEISDAAVSPIAAEACEFANLPEEVRREAAAGLYRRLMELSKNRMIVLFSDTLMTVRRADQPVTASTGAVLKAGRSLTSALSAPDGAHVADAIINLMVALDEV